MLYQHTNFHFSVLKFARAFLQTINSHDYQYVRQLRLSYYPINTGVTVEAEEAKERADAGFIRLCRQFVTALENLTSLEAVIDIGECSVEAHIAVPPVYKTESAMTTLRQLKKAGWVQALTSFRAMQKLSNVKVTLMGATHHDADLESWSKEMLRPGEQSINTWNRLVGFRRLLYGSASEAVRRLILGFGEEASWEDYIEMLEEYSAFRWDRRASTTATRANPAYANFLAKYTGSSVT